MTRHSDIRASRRPVGFAVGVGVLLLTSCGGGATNPDPAPGGPPATPGGEVIEAGEGRYALVNGETDGAMTALLEGTVQVIPGTDCWGVQADGAGTSSPPYVVVWPQDTTAATGPEQGVLELPGGQVVAEGDVVALGGGESAPLGDALPAVPGSCRSADVWVAGDVQ